MTTHASPDPVNRWATEHYGFEDDPPPAVTAVTASPTAVRHPSAAAGHGVGRRAALVAVGGVLGAALIAGIGGIAVADDRGGGGPGAGRTGRGPVGAVTQFDGGGPDGGRR